MPRNLPSLTSLLAFEAAARHLNFTAAGKELHLTQTAISHQIKNLEEHLATRLFVRRNRALVLTTAGQQYLESVRDAISLLQSATTRTRDEKATEVLTIHCLPTYAMQCLIPRLPEFQALHPNITLQVLTHSTFDQFRQRSYDIAFRYGTGQWRGLKTQLLQGEEIFPVCAPELARKINPEAPHAAMAEMAQIRTYFSSTYQDDWPVWIEAAGLGNIDFAREIIFNLQVTSLQAIVNGVGVGLGRTPLIDHYLQQGMLCAPFKLKLRTGSGYYIVCPEDKAEQRRIRVFWQWACDTLGMQSNE
ncbi:MAG: LysR family transcriptional regulator [Pusillimonas sp.]|nr:LysR family transcriptional regulator [Pusillimonas sp.]MBC42148.1 LysR family transcriptional regulator [Pusillimonas sp.]HCN70527.1 LysR family transcriptional regulator [Pusillimonas sp.]HCP77218.1 LysR family transcriptional regulator [Pusillimonas sp.]|tara:strand:+ start:6975 stop:7883 length:909 start_codon:yes stop_codon:yes gene_type:complete